MKNISRIMYDVMLLATVFYAPWWLLVVVSIAGAFFFHRYIEVVIAGVLYDVLYGVTGFGVLGLGGIMGIVSSGALLLIMEYIKKEIRA